MYERNHRLTTAISIAWDFAVEMCVCVCLDIRNLILEILSPGLSNIRIAISTTTHMNNWNMFEKEVYILFAIQLIFLMVDQQMKYLEEYTH